MCCVCRKSNYRTNNFHIQYLQPPATAVFFLVRKPIMALPFWRAQRPHLTKWTSRAICAYFPNGQAPGTEKFAYKLKWIDALYDWLTEEMARYPKLALLGDYNI